jgi:hypothetical protein
MSKRHPFRPSLNDIVLEDRVVLQSNASLAAQLELASAARGTQSFNNTQVSEELGSILSGIGTSGEFGGIAFETFGLTAPFTGTNASSQISQTVSNIRNSANAEAYFFQVQAANALSAVPGSSSALQIIKGQIGDNAQAGSLISAWQALLTSVPTTTPTTLNNTIPGTDIISGGMDQAQIATRLAVQTEFDISRITPSVSVSSTRNARVAAALEQQAGSQVSSVQSQINNAFASYSTQINNAFTGVVSGGNISQSSLNTLNGTIISATNALNTQITGIINPVTRSSELTPYIQNQLIGLDGGSLLQSLLTTSGSLFSGPDVTGGLSSSATAASVAKTLIQVQNFAVNNEVQAFGNALVGL